MERLVIELKQNLNRVNISEDERNLLLSSIHSIEKNINKNNFKLESLITQNKTTKEILNNIIKEIDKKNIEIQNYADTLKKTNKTKDRFFTIIAHDLKSPFNSLIGLSDLMKTSIKENNLREIERFNNIIIQVANKTFELLENLLNWARSQTNGITYFPIKVEINKLIKDNIELVKAQAEKKGLSIKVICKNKIYIYVDLNTISVIIRNLISNALKFTKEGGITIFVEEQKKTCVIKIIDTGIGIKKEKIDSIFDINGNVSTSGTDNEIGTGLGLILSKEFTKLNNGSITAASTLGQGSVFTLKLPIYKKEEKVNTFSSTKLNHNTKNKH